MKHYRGHPECSLCQICEHVGGNCVIGTWKRLRLCLSVRWTTSGSCGERIGGPPSDVKRLIWERLEAAAGNDETTLPRSCGLLPLAPLCRTSAAVGTWPNSVGRAARADVYKAGLHFSACAARGWAWPGTRSWRCPETKLRRCSEIRLLFWLLKEPWEVLPGAWHRCHLPWLEHRS